jgi:Ser/Thr protein kinase RdoA (MazF antagonist)
VFKDPESVMDNIVRVTHHVRMNVIRKGLSTKRFVLRAYLAKEDGRPFIIDDHGDYWRCYRFIKNAVTYDVCDDLKIIERAGEAFGRFQNCLEGFDAESLHITIPDFHNTIKRYEALSQAVSEDPCGRVESVREELDAIFGFEKDACELQRLLDNKEIPIRVTHNDTKCNNVVFSKTTLRPLAVIDLDTIMPGLCGYDFGDGARSICCTTMEDEKDLSKVAFNLDKFESFTKGYLTYLKSSLTDLEKQTLGDSIYSMTVELASRFLLDYINGDTYFKISYEDHNLVRTRCQLALAKDIDFKMEKIRAIINKYL